MNVIINGKKPRLVYFRWPVEKWCNHARTLFDRIFLTGLSCHFDLCVVDYSCDYGEVCDRLEPDVCLFESGNNGLNDPPLRISNTSSHPHVPKLGFIKSDPMCTSRSLFFGDMDRWGVTTFFTYVTAAGEYMPEVKERIFYWPFAIDPESFNNWHAPKTIPVLFMGNSTALQYPWRRSVRELVSSRFPTLCDTHLAWDPISSKWALHGKSYSQLINSALIAPTCGGFTKTLVNKHFEIPASFTLLVTEETPVLHSAGFVDGTNCIFADSANIIDKLNLVFENRDLLMSMISAGYKLIQERHLQIHRTQILDWYHLNRQRTGGQRIQQRDPFGQLRLVPIDADPEFPSLVSGAVDRRMIVEGDEHLCAGRYDSAEQSYSAAQEFCFYSPEPRLRRAWCSFLSGNPALSIEKSLELIQDGGKQNALEPDPVEWSVFCLSLLAIGNHSTAVEVANTFPQLSRLELDWTRWIVNYLVGDVRADLVREVRHLDGPRPGQRNSVHALPYQTFREFVSAVHLGLAASRADLLATRLKNYQVAKDTVFRQPALQAL